MDDDLRRLERLAKSGDTEAIQRLQSIKHRTGAPLQKTPIRFNFERFKFRDFGINITTVFAPRDASGHPQIRYRVLSRIGSCWHQHRKRDSAKKCAIRIIKTHLWKLKKEQLID